jgi:hypothetical protein
VTTIDDRLRGAPRRVSARARSRPNVNNGNIPVNNRNIAPGRVEPLATRADTGIRHHGDAGPVMNDRQLGAMERALKLYARAGQLTDEDLAGWMSYLQRRFFLTDAELAEVRERAEGLGRWAEAKVARLAGAQAARSR